MKIVVLDGYTLNPGDLSWEKIEKSGEFVVYDHTPEDKVLERAKDAEIVFTNKTVMNEELISKLSDKLKFIGVLATGYNVVDIAAAKKYGIVVTNIPTYGTASVAQMTFSLILELMNHVQKHSDAVKNGEWGKCRDFCFWNYPLIELEGKTLGLIGCGRIGQYVAKIASAFGMNILGYDNVQNSEISIDNFRWADIDTLLSESDIISLHCPLFPETKEIINSKSIAKMKDGVFIINTSRGPLIEEKALYEALRCGKVAGAAVDVLSVEPPRTKNLLIEAENCIVTPHISWATKEARSRLMDIAAENLKCFLEGKPINVIN